jgi:hypothetical protein
MSQKKPSPFVLACGNFFFKYRNAAFPAVFAVLFFIASPNELFANDPALARLVRWAGVALVAAGQAFRLMVIG